MFELNKDESLLNLLAPPEDHKFVCAIATTYSAKDKVIEEIIRYFDIAYDKEKMDEAFNNKKIMIFYQQGEYTGKNDIFYPQNDPTNNGTFHPKFWCIKYSNADNENIYRIIVSSCNLTNEDNLDCYVSLDGKLCDSESAFGKSVSEFLSQLNYKGEEGALSILRDEIKKVEFKDEAYFFFHNKLMEEKMIEDANNSQSAIIISPFIAKNSVEKFFGDVREKHLISRENQLDEMGNISGIENYVFSPELENKEETENSKVIIKSIHAKMYLYFQNDKTIIYIGSANCTRPAFNNNKEVLVRIEQGKIEDEKIKEFLNNFNKYEIGDNELILESKEQKEIDLLCRLIKNTFTYEKTKNGFKYRVIFKNSKAKIDLFINGKELELINGNYYETSEKNTHNILVLVGLGGEVKNISFLIKGIPNKFDSEKYIEQNIFDMLKKSSTLPSEGKNKTEKVNNKKMIKFQPSKQIELIYDINTQSNAKIMIDKINLLLEEIDDTLEIKEILKNGKSALEKLYTGGEDCGKRNNY